MRMSAGAANAKAPIYRRKKRSGCWTVRRLKGALTAYGMTSSRPLNPVSMMAAQNLKMQSAKCAAHFEICMRLKTAFENPSIDSNCVLRNFNHINLKAKGQHNGGTPSISDT